MIDLLPDDEQQLLADAFEEVLCEEAPLGRLRGDPAGEHALIARLAGLGWIGLGIAEEDGGLGLGVVEETLLMRAAGHHLIGTGLLAGLLAARLAAAEGSGQLLAALLSGRKGAALAIDDGADGLYRIDHHEDDVTLFIDGTGAAALLDEDALDLSRTLAIDDAVRLERGRRPIGSEGVPIGGRAAILTSAYLTGIAQRARDMATAYAKERQQFGQPIGAFQAIKHRCADMAVGCEAAWSLTVFGALALAEERPDARFQIAAARIVASDVALAAVRANVQVHGGMGFTEECDAQLLVKRLHLWLPIAGGPRQHRHALLGEPPPSGVPMKEAAA